MKRRIEPERVLVGAIGLMLFAFGFSGVVLADVEFSGDPIDGTADGAMWLGAEGNAWTFTTCMATGVLLFGACGSRAMAKTAAAVVGPLLASASVVALMDGSDVLGVLAANGTTSAIWGVTALLLLATGFAPGAPRDNDAWTPMDETRPEETMDPTRIRHPADGRTR